MQFFHLTKLKILLTTTTTKKKKKKKKNNVDLGTVRTVTIYVLDQKLYTPVSLSFTLQRWGLMGYTFHGFDGVIITFHGHVFLM